MSKKVFKFVVYIMIAALVLSMIGGVVAATVGAAG